MAIITLNNNSLSSVTSLPAGVGGKVLQVVTTKSTTQVDNTSTSTYVDAGLSASITPSSSSNKVLVLANQHILVSEADTRIGGSIRVLRDSTRIYGGNDQYDIFMQVLNSGSNNSQLYHRATLNILDSPSTTSSTTYKTQIIAFESGDFVRVQNNNWESTITLMEIEG